nr:uncharacterized protein LOC115256979 [Aedes albopictus]
MIRIVKNDLRKNATDVDVTKYTKEHLQLKLNSRTVRRRLREGKLFARRPAKKPLISAKNRKARLNFATRFQDWSRSDWQKVLWSDERKFRLFSSGGIRYVRRPEGQRYNPRYQVPTVKNGGGSVIVWEHLWEELERRIRIRTYRNSDDLMAGIEKGWSKIPIDRFNALVDSMPARCAAVIKSNGYATKY